MTQPRPLLAFGPATVAPIPTGKPQFQPPPVRPSASRQGQRLAPQFQALQQAVAAGRLRTTADTTEPDPELVVVFELVGTVDDFYRAVRRVPGLEFLTEFEEEDVYPDDDFHYVKDEQPTADSLPASLYVVLTNAQAVTELISSFERWQANPDLAFARGLAPLKRAFEQLREIRRWGPQDRVRETGLLEQWAEDVAVIGNSGTVRVEIELWFRSQGSRRADAQTAIQATISRARGTVVATTQIPAIDYHAVLADIPAAQVQAVLANGSDAIELLTTEAVMFVSPGRSMAVPALEISDDDLTAVFSAPPVGAPKVALLDGLPVVNHRTLAGRIILDDPDDVAARYARHTADHQVHGTAMASLIAHGDLNDPQRPLSTPIYARPILEPHRFDPSVAETVLDGQLLVDLLHRCFHRMFEGDGTQQPVAPSVRIVNLSIGDPARIFARRISPLAKLLDWIACRYNLLILVSAGNHPIDTTIPAESLADDRALRQAAATASYKGSRQRRLLSPAEAVNVLTVGAVHQDAATTALPDTVLDTVEAGMPAPYSAVGFGHRRSIKPEILLPGGRGVHQRPPPTTTDFDIELRPARTVARGPGLRVAAPGRGGVATAYSYGTSNATALGSRTASEVMDVLEALTNNPGDPAFPDAQFHPVLTKALLVHAASWGNNRARLSDLITPTLTRRDLSQILGYGTVDPTRVAAASTNRVVLLGAGAIQDGQRHHFALPLPLGLSATTEWRRLTITLGWLSPVNTRSQRHRIARLRFRPPEDLGVTRVEADTNAARNGTVQHEILEGTNAVVYATGHSLAIDVDCRIDGITDNPIRFGLAASLEIGATARIDIHAEIEQALQQRIQPRT